MERHAKRRGTKATAARPVAPPRRHADLATSSRSACGAVDLAPVAAPAEVDGRVAGRRAASKKTQGSCHRRPPTVGFWTRSPDPCETLSHVIAVTEDQGLLPLVLTFLSAVEDSVAELRGEGQAVGEPRERRFYEPVNIVKAVSPVRGLRRRFARMFALGFSREGGFPGEGIETVSPPHPSPDRASREGGFPGEGIETPRGATPSWSYNES